MSSQKSIKRRRNHAEFRLSRATFTTILVVGFVTAGLAYLLLQPSEREVIAVDGSSTVFPITAAWAEVLNRQSPQVQYIVSFSGTGAGFQKFCDRRTELVDASRPIRTSEVETCVANGLDPTAFQIAFDGVSVVVNKENTWAQALTVRELCRVWTASNAGDTCGNAGPRVTRWAGLNATWPDQPIQLWGPGTDSGTFDYFVEVILGPFGETPTDQYSASENDNVLVEGVGRELYALGYFGYAFATENLDRLNLVAIDDEDPTNGNGPILPTPMTIASQEYTPLSRPLFVYADALEGLARPAVRAFLEFAYTEEGQAIVAAVGFVPLSLMAIEEQLAKLGG